MFTWPTSFTQKDENNLKPSDVRELLLRSFNWKRAEESENINRYYWADVSQALDRVEDSAFWKKWRKE